MGKLTITDETKKEIDNKFPGLSDKLLDFFGKEHTQLTNALEDLTKNNIEKIEIEINSFAQDTMGVYLDDNIIESTKEHDLNLAKSNIQKTIKNIENRFSAIVTDLKKGRIDTINQILDKHINLLSKKKTEKNEKIIDDELSKFFSEDEMKTLKKETNHEILKINEIKNIINKKPEIMFFNQAKSQQANTQEETPPSSPSSNKHKP